MQQKWMATGLIGLMSIIPFFVKGQNSDQLGISVSPTFNHRTLTGSNARHDLVINSRNIDEQPRLGFTAGINYQKTLSDNLSFRGGIHFADRGYQMKFDLSKYFFADNIDPGYGFVYSTDAPLNENVETFKIIEQHYYIDIPLRLQYHFSHGKWGFYAFAGVSPNVFLQYQKKRIKKFEDGSKTTKRDQNSEATFNPLIVQGLFGGGVSYQLSDKIQIKAEPIGRISMNSFVDEPIKGYFWSGGLEIGGYYRF